MTHPALTAGRGAVITGGASGIGLAVAQQLLAMQMRVCIADRDADTLASALDTLEGDVTGEVVDVTQLEEVERLRDAAFDRFGDVAFLMNNAGTGGGGGAFSRYAGWQKVLGVNLWGVVHGLQSFVQPMIEQGTACAIVNTGSKQGLTNPPGDAAYNASKAGVRAVTESLAHELRNIDGCQVSAHLLVPGFTYTGLIKAHVPEKPPAAWLPEQVAEYLLAGLAAGDFYVLCPDNDVTVEMDHKRLQWNTADVVENRPALSRWHKDYAAAFEAFMQQPD